MGWGELTLVRLVHEPLVWYDSCPRIAWCWTCSALALTLFPPELIYLGSTSFLTGNMVSDKPSQLNFLLSSEPQSLQSHVWATQVLAPLSKHLAIYFHIKIPRNYFAKRRYVNDEESTLRISPNCLSMGILKGLRNRTLILAMGFSLVFVKYIQEDCLSGRCWYWFIIKKSPNSTYKEHWIITFAYLL